MSNDKSVTDKSTADKSDSEEAVRKSVFILKPKTNSLKSAENFLKNRAWDLRSTSEIKTALSALFKDPIDYALIGVDHPNASVLKLPDVISQTLKIPLIIFAESMTPQSSAMLRSTKFPYVLYPPVSGPAIERMLLKIEKDKIAAAQGKSADNNQGHAPSAMSEQEIAKIFEGAGLSPVQGGHFAASDRSSSSSTSSSSTSSSTSSSSSSASSPGSSSNDVHTAQSSSSQGPAYMGSAMGAPNGSSSNGQQNPNSYSTTNSDSDASGTIGMGRQQNPSSSEAAAASPSAFGVRQSSRTKEKPAIADPVIDTGKLHTSMFSLNKKQDKTSENDLTTEDLGINPKSAQSGDGSSYDSTSSYGTDSDYRRIVDHQSVLSNGTQFALRTIATQYDTLKGNPKTQETVSLKQCSNIACFEVESENISGVVVVAFGSDRVLDDAFLQELRDNVLLYMKNRDIDFTINDSMNLKIEQVEFEEWSSAEAAFLHKSVHGDGEVAISFFVNSDLKTPLEVSDDSLMLKISIDELRADKTLDFDVYLHMPQNNKYVRYVRKSGHISAKQWDRLTASGVSEMHVQKAAAPSVKRHRIQNFLNDKVTEFYASRKTDDAA